MGGLALRIGWLSALLGDAFRIVYVVPIDKTIAGSMEVVWVDKPEDYPLMLDYPVQPRRRPS